MRLTSVLFSILLVLVVTAKVSAITFLSEEPNIPFPILESFVQKEVPVEKILEDIQKGIPVEYDHVAIVGDLDLSHAINRSITSQIIINDCTIKGDVILREMLFQKPIKFKNNEFKGFVDFSNSTFNGPVDFSGSSFNNATMFIDSLFGEDAYFVGSNFKRIAIFAGSLFSKDSNFMNSEFDRPSDFNQTKFNGYAAFKASKFGMDLFFDGSRFEKDIDFSGSLFGGNVSFRNAWFNGESSFSESFFNYGSYFIRSRFKGSAFFEDANFYGNAYFDRSHFGDAFFEGSIFFKTLSLDRTKYDNLYIRWHEINELHFNDTAYILLMKNFNKLGFSEDYKDCYYEFRREEAALTKGFSSLIDRSLMYYTGYGVRPERLFIWAFFITMMFSFILYWKKALIHPDNSRRLSFMDSIQFTMYKVFKLIPASEWKPKQEWINVVFFLEGMGWLLYTIFLILLNGFFNGPNI